MKNPVQVEKEKRKQNIQEPKPIIRIGAGACSWYCLSIQLSGTLQTARLTLLIRLAWTERNNFSLSLCAYVRDQFWTLYCSSMKKTFWDEAENKRVETYLVSIMQPICSYPVIHFTRCVCVKKIVFAWCTGSKIVYILYKLSSVYYYLEVGNITVLKFHHCVL